MRGGGGVGGRRSACAWGGQRLFGWCGSDRRGCRGGGRRVAGGRPVDGRPPVAVGSCHATWGGGGWVARRGCNPRGAGSRNGAEPGRGTVGAVAGARGGGCAAHEDRVCEACTVDDDKALGGVRWVEVVGRGQTHVGRSMAVSISLRMSLLSYLCFAELIMEPRTCRPATHTHTLPTATPVRQASLNPCTSTKNTRPSHQSALA